MINKLKSPLFLLIILLVVSISFIIGPYLINNLPFEYGGDLKPSWFAFYTELKNLFSISDILKYGRLPFYSWDMFLGTNWWASKGFYGLGDIFNYLTLYLPFHFYEIFSIHVFLKTLTAGLAFYFFMNQVSENKLANVITSLSYSLSSWYIFYIGQMTFASFYALFPLYLLSLEHYFKSKNGLWFSFMSALLLFNNFYLFFTISIFTALYFSYRYYLLNVGFSGYFKSTLKIIGFYLLGVSITAILTIPTVLYMTGSDRVGGILDADLVFKPIIYWHQLVALFVPSHLYIYSQNLFETGYHTTRELFLWASSISTLLLPQVFTDQDKKYRNATLVLFAVLIIILILPMGGSMMHGFSEPSFRWTFLFISFSLMTSNRYLSDLTFINQKTLNFSLIVISVLVLLTIPFILFLEGNLNQLFVAYPLTYTIYFVSFLAYLILYFILKSKNSKILYLILALTFIELSTYAYLNLVKWRMNDNTTWEFVESATHVLQDTDNELNNFLLSLDPNNAVEYFRVYVPHESLYWSYSHNMNIHYQLQGLMTYDSTYAPSFNALKQLAPQVKDFESNWIFNIKDPNLVNFLNVKYAIVTDQSELPHEYFTLITDTYRWSFSVYENQLYRPLGTSYSKIMSYETLKLKFDNNTHVLLDYLVVDEEDTLKIKPYLQSKTQNELTDIVYYGNQLDAKVVSDDTSFMVISLPYDKGWRITVNNQSVETYNVNGGFIGIPIVAGENLIHMQFVPEGFRFGFYLSVMGSLIFIYLILKPYIKRKPA